MHMYMHMYRLFVLYNYCSENFTQLTLCGQTWEGYRFCKVSDIPYEHCALQWKKASHYMYITHTHTHARAREYSLSLTSVYVASLCGEVGSTHSPCIALWLATGISRGLPASENKKVIVKIHQL